MAKVVSNTSKATEAMHKAPEHPSGPVHLIQHEVWLVGPGLQNKPCGGFRRLCVETEAVRIRERPVTLASIALGPASPSEEKTDEDALPPPLHLMVPVDLCKGSGGKGNYPYWALANTGTTCHYMS
jgi:hypothetical protein